MYAVMCFEVEPRDVPHIEADTFWLFEAMLGEFSELEDEEGGRAWTKKLSERLAWADQDLSDTLVRLAGASSVAYLIDVIAERERTRSCTPALFLSMVGSDPNTNTTYVVFHTRLGCFIRLCDERQASEPQDRTFAGHMYGNAHQSQKAPLPVRRPLLVGDENDAIPPPPLPRAWEFEDAFRDGVSLLQNYPIGAAGGIERILQTAAELSKRRIDEMKAVKSESLTLGERLRVSMWKGFTNQVSSPNESPNGRLRQRNCRKRVKRKAFRRTMATLPRGLAGRTSSTGRYYISLGYHSVERYHEPVVHGTPSVADTPMSPTSSSGFWKYAEKLKESDTVATLSKVSSNWRAKSLLGSWGSRSTPSSPFLSPNSALSGSSSSEPPEMPHPRLDESRRGSLPPAATVYSPPPRPAFFRQPRDSFLPHSRKSLYSLCPTAPKTLTPKVAPSAGGSDCKHH
ncbi:regulator of Vps4 activity in the MVB pathway-domain-containing [Salix suchowensis]|nr:regulator of Vps4 activity in the MVB pathway-domain-containing [Salix suchowensis]